MSLLSQLIRDEPPDEPGRDDPARLSLDEVFEEEPVPLDVFVRDSRFLASPALSEPQYEAVRYAERVYYQDLYPLMEAQFGSYWRPQRMINEVTLEWGKGSGKDHICRVTSLRIAYLLLCLRSPQRYYGLPTQDTIHMLNIASSANQAYQAFFAPITRVVKRGWFDSHCEPKLNTISFAKNVESISGNSDAETQEGLNLILGIADEIDAFRSKAELLRYHGKAEREPVKSAEAILDMITTSASTRFPETHKVMRISYPRYKGSKIQKLRAEAEEDVAQWGVDPGDPNASRHYVDGPRATWDVNPRYAGYERVSIAQTDVPVPNIPAVIKAYRRDRVSSRTRFECKPERAIDTYFKNMDALKAACRGDSPLKVETYRVRTLRSEVTGAATPVWEPVYSWADDFQPIAGARYAMHADLALTGDRAGVAMSHVVRYETVTDVVQDEAGADHVAEEQQPVVKTDFVLAFESDVGAQPAREIQIRWARQLAFELIKRGFNVVSCTFDGFQSADSMQILDSHGVRSERVSMDLKDDPWKNWRDLAYDGRWHGPLDQLMLDEVEGLGRFNGKVDHPPGGSKDLADAACGSIFGAVVEGGSEDPEGAVSYFAGMGGIEIGTTDLLGPGKKIGAYAESESGLVAVAVLGLTDGWGEDEAGFHLGLPIGMEGLR